MNKKDIIEAYCRIRQIDNTIPDDVLDFMKDCAIEKLPKEEEKIKVTAMYDLNNVYQEQHVRVGFEVNHPIPEEKYPAIKKAIEEILNNSNQ